MDEKTVLLCDPDLNLGTLYSRQLRKLPIRLVQCDSEAALRTNTLGVRPDLVLLNAEFPTWDGYKLCRQLKQNELTLTIPVIMLSDLPNTEQRQRAHQAGALDLIPRIPSPTFLQERIAIVLFEHQTMSLAHRLTDERFTVLVAEDSLSLQQFYEQVLSSLNCDVLLCEDGNSAWQALQQNQDVDLIIADLYMPKMDGRELCNLIRSHYQFDQIPVVVITTEKEKPVLLDLLNQGVNDYVQKPFREEELRARVPHTDLTEFAKNPDINKLADLFTVSAIVNYVDGRMNPA